MTEISKLQLPHVVDDDVAFRDRSMRHLVSVQLVDLPNQLAKEHGGQHDRVDLRWVVGSHELLEGEVIEGRAQDVPSMLVIIRKHLQIGEVQPEQRVGDRGLLGQELVDVGNQLLSLGCVYAANSEGLVQIDLGGH